MATLSWLDGFKKVERDPEVPENEHWLEQVEAKAPAVRLLERLRRHGLQFDSD